MTDRLNPEALRTVADVILLHCGGYVDTTRADAERAARAVLRKLAALPAPRTITTVEELEALPVGTILRDYAGLALHKRPTGTWWCTNGTTGLTDADLANEIEDTTFWYTVLWVPTEGGGE